MHKMYDDLAHWWPLLSPLDDYADEAAFFGQVLASGSLPPTPSLLELGCGGGNNAFYLKKMFSHVTLSDLSPNMLAVSRALNPDCEHVDGDMRTLRLGRVFDAVFIHDAIDYMTTLADLRQAMETAFVHCQASGVALWCPTTSEKLLNRLPTTPVAMASITPYAIWSGRTTPTTPTQPTRPIMSICCARLIARCRSSMTSISGGYSRGRSGLVCCKQLVLNRRSSGIRMDASFSWRTNPKS